MLRIVKLTKENGSDQEGYVISNPELEHSYLQVTDQRLGCDEKRVLKFTTPEQVEVGGGCEFKVRYVRS